VNEDSAEIAASGEAAAALAGAGASPGAPVLLERSGRIACITLNRPAVANAIDQGLAAALRAVLEAIAAGPPPGAVLLQGAGRTFCGGGDLQAFNREGTRAPAYVAALLADFHVAVQRLAELPVPVVVAVQGAAAGAGLGLALAADIVLAAEDSRFVMAYGAVGLTPDGGTSWGLPRAVGLRRALELTLLNRPLTAAEAQAAGLVTRVVPAGDLARQAQATAVELAAGPTAALVASKRLLRESLGRDLGAQLAAEERQIVESFATHDGAEGVRAFCERRPPRFRGT